MRGVVSRELLAFSLAYFAAVSILKCREGSGTGAFWFARAISRSTRGGCSRRWTIEGGPSWLSGSAMILLIYSWRGLSHVRKLDRPMDRCVGSLRMLYRDRRGEGVRENERISRCVPCAQTG